MWTLEWKVNWLGYLLGIKTPLQDISILKECHYWLSIDCEPSHAEMIAVLREDRALFVDRICTYRRPYYACIIRHWSQAGYFIALKPFDFRSMCPSELIQHFPIQGMGLYALIPIHYENLIGGFLPSERAIAHCVRFACGMANDKVSVRLHLKHGDLTPGVRD